MMKGIILAGGTGSRLYPLTKTTSKQLLPVYDKPMVYYPLATLMSFDIRDILVISTPEDTPNIERLFGDGSSLGLHISYAVQPEPKGIAQAFTIGADFIGNDYVCLILGDNIFYMEESMEAFRREAEKNAKQNLATIFACHVSDPCRFGVVEFDAARKAVSIEEKPKKPKSNYVSVGLYFYPPDVAQKAASLQYSARGELEITDLNNIYLRENRMSVIPLRRGTAWLDAGTPDSLMDAALFVQITEKRQGLKIACIEEIAYNRGFIDKKGLLSLIDGLKEAPYKTYLRNLIPDGANR